MTRQEQIAPEIVEYQKQKKAQIYNTYKEASSNKPVAQAIVKAEFDEKYPADKFEYYTLSGIDKFRNELMKAEDIEDKDGAFVKACEGLMPYIVYNEGKKVITFVRAKK